MTHRQTYTNGSSYILSKKCDVMNKRILLLGILLMLISVGYAQQNIQFSQYVFNGLTVNPAYAGYKENLYFNATYRQQWVGYPGAPQTGGVSLDGLTGDRYKRMGLGAQVTWDKLGPQQTLNAYGYYAYRIQLDAADTRRLCLGIGVGINQYSIDGGALIYVDPNDPDVPAVRVNSISPDARFGIYYYTPKFYLGASVMDLFAINGANKTYSSNGVLFSSIKKTPHLYLTSGVLLDVSDNFKLKPSLMLKEDFNGPTSVDINLFMLLGERLWIGGSYRSAVKIWSKENLQPGLEQKGAASALMELYMTANLRLGYSYDFTTSGISTYQSGTHEISLGILFPNKRDQERIRSPRYF